MRNLIIVIALLTGFVPGKHPKDITGKWLVDNVDVSKMSAKMTKQQKLEMNKQLITPLKNAVFEFKADHHFYMSPGLQSMPRNDYWLYDNENSTITITEYNNHQAVLMKITLFEKDGNTFFAINETTMILKVHKKEE